MSELGRRAVHASGSLAPLLYLAGVLDLLGLRLLLVGVAAVVTVLEGLRLGPGALPAALVGLFDRLTREYEQDNLAGYALYAYSMAGVALAAPPYAAVPAMLMLTLGDPVSGLLGSAGPGGRKRLPVLAAMFGVCLALGLGSLWLLSPPGTPRLWLAAAALGALGATLADGFKPVVAGYVVDDNITIPPAAALGVLAVVGLAG